MLSVVAVAVFVGKRPLKAPKVALFFAMRREGLALHKFPDGNFARARPRGFCLSGADLKQKHCCGFRVPRAHKAVYVLLLINKK